MAPTPPLTKSNSQSSYTAATTTDASIDIGRGDGDVDKIMEDNKQVVLTTVKHALTFATDMILFHVQTAAGYGQTNHFQLTPDVASAGLECMEELGETALAYHAHANGWQYSRPPVDANFSVCGEKDAAKFDGLYGLVMQRFKQMAHLESLIEKDQRYSHGLALSTSDDKKQWLGERICKMMAEVDDMFGRLIVPCQVDGKGRTLLIQFLETIDMFLQDACNMKYPRKYFVAFEQPAATTRDA